MANKLLGVAAVDQLKTLSVVDVSVVFWLKPVFRVAQNGRWALRPNFGRNFAFERFPFADRKLCERQTGSTVTASLYGFAGDRL